MREGENNLKRGKANNEREKHIECKLNQIKIRPDSIETNTKQEELDPITNQ